MNRIDAHQHFWQFDPVRDNWITDDMAAIRQDFLPVDLKPILQQHGFDGCVAVQASQSENETDFLIALETQNDFIRGVVGWIDLQAADVAERLARYKAFPVVKGFRHVLQGEPQRDLMLQPAFKRGIQALQDQDYTYDLLIFPDQLAFSNSLVAAFPEQRFVVDHMAKPYIKRKEIAAWKNDMEQLATHAHVYCKISGMVTEAAWQSWTKADFKPYLDVVVHAFGTERIMFGSDWPVCLVAAGYAEMLDIVQDYFAAYSKEEQDLIFGGNATRFYNL